MTNIMLSVIIPVRNRSGDRLENCLRSLRWQEDIDHTQVEILIVDFGSDAEHKDAIQKALNEIKTVKAENAELKKENNKLKQENKFSAIRLVQAREEAGKHGASHRLAAVIVERELKKEINKLKEENDKLSIYFILIKVTKM